jgi:hypothetical protein
LPSNLDLDRNEIFLQRGNVDPDAEAGPERQPMLNSLSYANTFASTGQSLAGSFAFRAGFGAITGPNESGKSFLLEMIRFCLFGSPALPGKAGDYKKLKAELAFTVNNQAYRVVRNNATATLWRATEKIAVGVKPVNARIVRLLGFGLEVFDVACVANQGDIERLGSMKPTERKRMVDCGLPMSQFRALCSVQPVRFTDRIERWDRRELDSWLDRFMSSGFGDAEEILARLG